MRKATGRWIYDEVDSQKQLKLPWGLLNTHLVFQRLNWALLHNFGRDNAHSYIAFLSTKKPAVLAQDRENWARDIAIVMGVFEKPGMTSAIGQERRIVHHIGIHRLPFGPQPSEKLAVSLHGFAVWALGKQQPPTSGGGADTASNITPPAQIHSIQTEPAPIMITELGRALGPGNSISPVFTTDREVSYHNNRWSLQGQEAYLKNEYRPHFFGSDGELLSVMNAVRGNLGARTPQRFVMTLNISENFYRDRALSGNGDRSFLYRGLELDGLSGYTLEVWNSEEVGWFSVTSSLRVRGHPPLFADLPDAPPFREVSSKRWRSSGAGAADRWNNKPVVFVDDDAEAKFDAEFEDEDVRKVLSLYAPVVCSI